MSVRFECLCAAVFLAVAACGAHTAEYPARPVRLIVPFPPAGGTDIAARLLAQKLGETLRQQFVIDNRPGAAGTIGAHIAAKSAPDGYTLLFVTASYAISAGYYKNLPYDSVKDFTPVSPIATAPLVLAVHPSVRAGSVTEFVALAKSSPARLHYASGGAGGINHLAGELFNALAGTQLVHVPYKGAGPALTALVSGEAQMMIATLGSALSHTKSGKLKALAVAGERRAGAAPDLPTMAEAGLRGYVAENWYGLLAPRGTPAAIVGLLNREITAALKSDEVSGQFAKLGFEPMSDAPPAQFGEYLRRDVVKWARVLKSAGIALEATP